MVVEKSINECCKYTIKTSLNLLLDALKRKRKQIFEFLLTKLRPRLLELLKPSEGFALL